MNTKGFLDKFKNGFYLLTYAFILVLILMHFSDIWQTFIKFVGLLSPLFYGVVIAFILNVPMNIIEHWLIEQSKGEKKWHRAIAILLTIVLAIVIVFILSSVIFPQVIENIMTLASNIRIYLNNLVGLVNDLLKSLHLDRFVQLDNLFDMPLNDMISSVAEWFSKTAPEFFGNTLNATISIASGVANVFMAFILSLYLLASKEKYVTQYRKVCVALCSKKVYERIFYIMDKVNVTFTNFISGQLLEACILGGIFYVAMLLLRIPYALLISCCIAVTSIVPIFGAMIGMCFGFILILAINPIQSIIFFVVFQLIQQFEGNVIYPRVVGNSVGLPGIWVLLSILVFGGMYGLMGMLIAVPTTAVIYTLIRESINARLDAKKMIVTKDTIEEMKSQEVDA
ncbi:MAG: AI-2E family transporter [Erysipelotrichaceae bacterium]|nr:AI-2E family transporter [Erysipelotrichaceae bacterium]